MPAFIVVAVAAVDVVLGVAVVPDPFEPVPAQAGRGFAEPGGCPRPAPRRPAGTGGKNLRTVRYTTVNGEVIASEVSCPVFTSGPLGGAITFWEAGIGGAEVQVDEETGAVKLLKYVSLADVGRAINPRGNTSFEQQMADLRIIAGTPKTVVAKLKRILEETRPGILALWGNDGKVSQEDSLTCIRLMGQEVFPAIREIAKSLDLKSPFEANAPVSISQPAPALPPNGA